MDTNIIIFHKVDAPYSMDAVIEVYGGDGEGWSEWRIVDGAGETVQDTGTEGAGTFRGRQYGSPEIALRDALMVASGLDDPHQLEMQRVQNDSPEP